MITIILGSDEGSMKIIIDGTTDHHETTVHAALKDIIIKHVELG